MYVKYSISTTLFNSGKILIILFNLLRFFCSHIGNYILECQSCKPFFEKMDIPLAFLGFFVNSACCSNGRNNVFHCAVCSQGFEPKLVKVSNCKRNFCRMRTRKTRSIFAISNIQICLFQVLFLGLISCS